MSDVVGVLEYLLCSKESSNIVHLPSTNVLVSPLTKSCAEEEEEEEDGDGGGTSRGKWQRSFLFVGP